MIEMQKKHDTLDYIIQITNNTVIMWRDAADAFAPHSVSEKLDKAMLEWMREMTYSLRLWTDKGYFMTIGEIILARSNLGALVESWLKFFYCVYNEDYQDNPMYDKHGNIIEPEELSFEFLKQKSRGILYQLGDDWDRWIERVQKKRNAIHIFNYRDIGNADDFYDDVEKLYDFIIMITDRIPCVEEYIDSVDGASYPEGYHEPWLKRNRMSIERVGVLT